MSTATLPEATEMSTAEKLRLYLAAHCGFSNPSYEVCAPGKCWKDNAGRFTIKSRFRFTKPDGLAYTKGFKAKQGPEAFSEEDALKIVFFGHIRERRIHLCNRCGGAGGSRSWPGFTCFDCGGNGVDPRFDWEGAVSRALDGEDFAGDYLAKVAAKKVEQDAQAERARQETIAARQRSIEANQRAVEECLPELLPRVQRAREFYATGNAHKDMANDHLSNLICFQRDASAPNWENAINSTLNLSWIQNFILPAILKAEEATKRAAEDSSDYIGTEGEPLTVEATIVFQKDFKNDFGTKTLNVLRDDKGNRVTYWNNFTIIDPIQAQAFDNDGKRYASKGDKIRFTATVKKHEVYKGVRATVIQRARKGVLIKAADQTEGAK